MANTMPAPVQMPMPASPRTLACQAIERTLAALDGNASASAKVLGISRYAVYRRRQALAGQAS